MPLKGARLTKLACLNDEPEISMCGELLLKKPVNFSPVAPMLLKRPVDAFPVPHIALRFVDMSGKPTDFEYQLAKD